MSPLPLVLLLAALVAAPAAAELDPDFGGFGGNGTVAVFDPPFVDDVARQPDGRIVVVGGDAAARYEPTGELDESFGTGGVAPLPGVQGEVVAVQPDGRIVVAGNLGRDWGVVRLLSSGSLDLSFASGGVATADFDGRSQDVADIVLQPDGKILVAGSAGPDTAIARFGTDGSLDPGFGDGGEVFFGFGRTFDRGLAIALQADGKIVIAGQWDDSDIDLEPNNNDADFGVGRLHKDGTPDTSFGGNGKVQTGFGGEVEFARSVVVQEDGKIVVAGFKGTDGPNGRIALARYDPDGSLDASFGDGGKVITDPTPDADDAGFELVLQRDGKLVLAAEVDIGEGTGRGVLFRYRTDGSLDPSLGFEQDPALRGFRSLLLQPDGRFLASAADGTLRRYRPSGRPDVAGSVSRDFDRHQDRAFDVTVLPGGRIVVAGEARLRGLAGVQVALARYRPDGRPDLEYGVDGRAFAGFAGADDRARALVASFGGTTRAAGTRDSTSDELAVFGHDFDGTTDLDFGRGAITSVDFGCDGNDFGTAIARQPDGKLVVAGSVPAALFGGDCGPLRMGVARFGADGGVDAEGFSGDGLATGHVSSGLGSFSVATDVGVQSSGRIVVAGWGQNESVQHVGMLGLEPDGSPDLTGFGFQGDVRTEVGDFSRAEAMAIQEDDRIVLAGHSDREDDGDFLVARYTERGVLDSSFGEGGVVLTDFGGDEAAYDVAIQPEGRILVAGSADSLIPGSPIFLARYLPDGRRDFEFGDQGRKTLSLPSDVAVRGIALHPPEGVVIAGYTHNGSDDDFFLARALAPIEAPEPGPRTLGAAALATLALLEGRSRRAA